MRCSKGSILIVVLFVLIVLSTAALSFTYRTALESRVIRDRVVRCRLRAHARSAMAIAISRLSDNSNEWDHPAEPWCSHDPLSSESWLSEWSEIDQGASVYVTTYRVEDEFGKLNLQYASSEDMESLGMSSEQIDSLFDWIDTDDVTRVEGAEKDYYRFSSGFLRCKDAPLEALDELLLIRGFTREQYYGAVFEGYSAEQEYETDCSNLALVSLLTCFGDGKLNPNTAPLEILRTLPLSEYAADQIVAFREHDAGSIGNLEDHVFRSPEDIDQLQGLTFMDKDILKRVSVYRSSIFRIYVRSRHVPTGIECREECLVRAVDHNPIILQHKVVR